MKSLAKINEACVTALNEPIVRSTDILLLLNFPNGQRLLSNTIKTEECAEGQPSVKQS